MEKRSFSENQNFSRYYWIWVIPLGLLLLFGYMFVEQIIFHHKVGNRPGPDLLVIFLLLIPFLFIYFLLAIRLLTRVDSNGIQYRFAPFQRSFRIIKWDEIENITIDTYHPIGEYGGYGYRIASGKKYMYNVSGNVAMFIKLKKGSLIGIGTRMPEELRIVLNEYFYHLSDNLKP